MDSGFSTFVDPSYPKPTIADEIGIREVEGGFPHSEILGSKLVRSSPRLIAAYHVLHRLSAPRHPPDALIALDRSHDRCPPSLAGRPTSVRKDHACQPCPGERPLRGASWSAGDVVSRNPNMVPLHDVKHPRISSPYPLGKRDFVRSTKL